MIIGVSIKDSIEFFLQIVEGEIKGLWIWRGSLQDGDTEDDG